MVWNKLEVSWFELLEIPFKQQCNAHIISGEIFLELKTFSSKVCCFDEELPLTFKIDSSTETGGSLAEKDLKKQDILITTDISSLLDGNFSAWIPMFESLIISWQSLQ